MSKAWTNERVTDLAKRYARRFKLRFLSKGKLPDLRPGAVVGFDMTAVLYVTRDGKGVGLVAADCDAGCWVRVTPESVERAIREGKGRYGSYRNEHGRWRRRWGE